MIPAATVTPPGFATLDGFAPRQPYADMPDPGLPTVFGEQVCDIGEDGDQIILGHVGLLRAVAVFHRRWRTQTAPIPTRPADPHERDVERLRTQLAAAETAHWMGGDLDRTLDAIRHTWAALVPRCDTYPRCRSLGPTPDGHPCHDDRGAAAADHRWDDWRDRPDSLPPPRPGRARVAASRTCERCFLVQVRYVDGSVTTAPTNRCGQCYGIDECGGFYIEYRSEPDVPGAFPITLWSA